MLLIEPFEASVAVTVYWPLSTQLAPGARLGQVVAFGVVSGSLTCTFVSGALPVLVAVTRNVSTSPWVTLFE